MVTLASGFTLALGGGGARGYAHLGVAEALAERGLVPAGSWARQWARSSAPVWRPA